MWGIPALLFLIAFSHRVAPGVIAKDLMQAFDTTSAVVGLLSATYFCAYAALMVPAGVLIDAFGVRRVVAAGGAVMGLGTVTMGLAPTEAVLFAGRFAVGLGASVTFVGTLKVAATWFPPRQFGTLSAITATVGVLGALAGTAPLAALVSAAGWRGAFLLIGLLTVGGAGLCYGIVRDRPGAEESAGAPPPDLRGVMAGTLEVLRNPHTWPPFLAFFCLYGASSNLMLWVVPYLRDVYALSTVEAAIYAAATSLALLFAGPLTGFASDRILRRRKLPYTLLASSSFVLWVVLVATLGTLPLPGVYALLFGMGAVGTAFVLTWPIGREVNPPPLAGVAVAVVNMGGFVGAFLTHWPMGAVLDARWAGVITNGARAYPVEAYRAAFSLCALLVLLAVVISLFLRETRGRNIYDELRDSAA